MDLQNEPPSGAGVERLFIATSAGGQAQPITGPIQIGAAPASVAPAGTNPPPTMLWFGTGRHLAADDRSDLSSQSVYGIVDRLAGPVVRGDLQRQAINVSSGLSGTVGGKRVDYAGASAGARQHGWVLDLPHAGERLIGWPVVRHGRLIFASLVPDADRCFAGASSIFVVDPHDGVAPATRTFVNHPGADFIASTAGIVLDLVPVDAGTKAYLFAAGSGTPGGSGAAQLEPVVPLPASVRGRTSWREVLR